MKNELLQEMHSFIKKGEKIPRMQPKVKETP